jgi:hypothetical protein
MNDARKKTLAAIQELDTRRESHRTVAQVGIVIMQMQALGWCHGEPWRPDDLKASRTTKRAPKQNQP